MTDTPQHIKKIQLHIWLSKTPSERLAQFLRDNQAFFEMIETAKKSIAEKVPKDVSPIN